MIGKGLDMMKKVTTSTIRKMKTEGQPVVMLTAYDYPTAKILDEKGVDIILVGDSLGMVVLGYENTTKVTMEDMIHHTKAVSRSVNRSLIVSDMPFLSYHISLGKAVENAGRLVQEGGAQAVKLEGGMAVLDRIEAIINAGIPVMGHLGLSPQSVNQLGGYFIQGKSTEEAERILKDAQALEKAGVFSIVLECVPSELGRYISQRISIPTIGIGAGKDCDGQVLVLHDMLGIDQNYAPKFVKQYGDMGTAIGECVESYICEVKNRQFPDQEHSFFSEELSHLK